MKFRRVVHTLSWFATGVISAMLITHFVAQQPWYYWLVALAIAIGLFVALYQLDDAVASWLGFTKLVEYYGIVYALMGCCAVGSGIYLWSRLVKVNPIDLLKLMLSGTGSISF